ncbi:homoserine O-acetyltransferase [Marinihelvus fidelis]|uniref:Serine O-succinyltransferase n=1 Tax=Marinihelvus fidelis TaxID=2613842 RepID=A0A5N0TB43_9GAMM|nr:homoserine O-acetyltransferase [Marinihelvus fidelis]KAA9130559.1 homoserine O-acetyltransferase [Marinihelvus fidelis]
MSATQIYKHDQPFAFTRGGQLDAIELAYETWGELNEARSNAVLIHTGLSPSAHAASCAADPEEGWWEFMVGPGKPIDTERFFVICVNSLGSCKGSTGPASINPATGRPWRRAFPLLALEDIAAASRLVLRHLGVGQLCALVGPSMGGMTTLAHLRQDPMAARHLLSISSAPRAEPFSIAIRSLQREMIVTDPNWKDGQYSDDAWPENGMRLARKLGMVSYRSAIEWQDRFGRDQQSYYDEAWWGMRYEVESYLEAAARRFIGAFDPCSYLYLSSAMDRFDASAGCEDGLAEALADVRLDSALVIGVDTDVLFPARQQGEIARTLIQLGIDTRLEMLPSPQGHDAFLVDSDNFGSVVGGYFRSIAKRENIAP